MNIYICGSDIAIDITIVVNFKSYYILLHIFMWHVCLYVCVCVCMYKISLNQVVNFLFYICLLSSMFSTGSCITGTQSTFGNLINKVATWIQMFDLTMCKVKRWWPAGSIRRSLWKPQTSNSNIHNWSDKRVFSNGILEASHSKKNQIYSSSAWSGDILRIVWHQDAKAAPVGWNEERRRAIRNRGEGGSLKKSTLSVVQKTR